jgi:hypothetical protein
LDTLYANQSRSKQPRPVQNRRERYPSFGSQASPYTWPWPTPTTPRRRAAWSSPSTSRATASATPPAPSRLPPVPPRLGHSDPATPSVVSLLKPHHVFFLTCGICAVPRSQVMRHLIAAGHELHVATAVPEFVLTAEVRSPRLRVRRALLDCGFVQADPLTVDPLATLEKVTRASWFPSLPVSPACVALCIDYLQSGTLLMSE